MDYFTLRTTLNTASVPAGREPRLLYLLAELVPNVHMPLQRAPVNLSTHRRRQRVNAHTGLGR